MARSCARLFSRRARTIAALAAATILLASCERLIIRQPDPQDLSPPIVTVSLIGHAAPTAVYNLAGGQPTQERARGILDGRQVSFRLANDRQVLQLLVSARDPESGISGGEVHFLAGFECVVPGRRSSGGRFEVREPIPPSVRPDGTVLNFSLAVVEISGERLWREGGCPGTAGTIRGGPRPDLFDIFDGGIATYYGWAENRNASGARRGRLEQRTLWLLGEVEVDTAR